MKSYYENQIQKGLSLNTARQQESVINAFLLWCEIQKIKPKNASYNHVLAYVDHLKNAQNKPATIRFKLRSLSHYFDFLQCKINVADQVKFRNGTRILLHLQLENEELEAIFEAQNLNGIANKRNKVVLSLLIYQGLQSDDFERIELKDIDLENGKIHVPGSRFMNARILDLNPKQTLLFQDYLLNIRPALLIENATPTDQFIVNLKGKKHTNSGLVFTIMKPLKIQFPKLKNATQIRQSLITNWVKMYGLRQAQYLAGHKFVSSTERYNEDKTEALRAEMKLFHPF
jgi:site-specific recombinase XerD